ncbi:MULTISPECIES: SDR family oxidoreductase [Ramlibacter]|uniref:SDR family oxidoreductase n=1 Tax=Ramlibacter pinisoli TaxID=2682844 RepID=A0A6N8IWZ8_9BURK|nr:MULTISPECIES: SDR family oxidoreductase [Ramlibacter]MBA2961413.1 SDR family oxidoreductase [Ramlibacter sp. CGMCC 1.13660]MVQ31357.1 SDR family oxidoreductase [Ramlibacter pinisoli]
MSTNTSAARVAVVTGGSRGIGRAIALALARQGWDVCISYASNAAAADETVKAVQQAGRQALAVQADMASHADIQRLFAACRKTFGRLDALVNNAGVVGGLRSIFDADPAHLREVFDANVLGCFLCAGEAAKAMSTQKGGQGGAIVNMSSVAARTGGMPQEAHYAASKGAVDSLTLALTRELAPHGIRVNAVRPGLIDTSIHEAHGGQATLDKLAPTVPLARVGTVDEVAEVVAFLCGPQSSYMHGALVDVSGGR